MISDLLLANAAAAANVLESRDATSPLSADELAAVAGLLDLMAVALVAVAALPPQAESAVEWEALLTSARTDAGLATAARHWRAKRRAAMG